MVNEYGEMQNNKELWVWINKKEKIKIKLYENQIRTEIEKELSLLALTIFEIFNEEINKSKEINIKINKKEIKIKNFEVEDIIKELEEKIEIEMKLENKDLKSFDIFIWLESPNEEEGYLMNLEEERRKK